MATVKKQAVMDYVYQLTLTQQEAETLFVILANVSSSQVAEQMGDYGIKYDESVDIPYDLYQTVRDALAFDLYGKKEV